MKKKGDPKTGGRQKGVQNKTTQTVKQLLMDTMHKLQSHPKANIDTWAAENPTEFYKLMSKLIPTEIVGKNGGDLFQMIVNVNNEKAKKQIESI